MKPVAVQLYTLRDRFKDDMVGTLKDIAAIGYKGVEPAGMKGHNPADVTKVMRDLGLVATSAHIGLPTRETVNTEIEVAKTLGYNLLIANRSRQHFASLDAIKETADLLQQAHAMLKPHGLRMGYHNHDFEFDPVNGRMGMEILLELAPDILWQVDTCHASNFGRTDVPKFMSRYTARIASIHAKDSILEQGCKYTAVGKGKVDVIGCIKAGDPAKVEWIIVELDSCETDMLTAVKESYAFLTGKGLAQGNR